MGIKLSMSQIIDMRNCEWAQHDKRKYKPVRIVDREYKPRYVYDTCTLKQYGDRYVVQWQSVKPNKGVSRHTDCKSYDYKLDESISRSKKMIREYAMCNDWQYFVTLTLDKHKVDRYDLKATYKKISQYIRDTSQKYGIKIKYLLIPEKHKDGAWHFHGFMSDIPSEELKLSKKRTKDRQLYNWIGYQDKFGFCDIETIGSLEKATSYISKYISKDMALSVHEIGAKTYYASRGLNKSKVIKIGRVSDTYKPDWIKYNDFDMPVYSVMTLPKGTQLNKALQYIKDTTDTDFLSIVDDYGVLQDSVPIDWI